MKKLKLVLVLGILAVFLAGCSDELIEDSLQKQDLKTQEMALKAGHEKLVPIKGIFTINYNMLIGVNPSPPPITLYMDTRGDGKLSHLGKTKVLLDQTWYPPGPPPSLDFPWSGTGTGKIKFIAANGDELLAEYDDAVSIHHSPSEVTSVLTGHFIEGGSGRFAMADGYFEWTVEFNPIIKLGTANLSGEISYKRK